MNPDPLPFCGAPPLPSELWTRWLFDPLLYAGFALLAVIIWRHQRDARLGWTSWGLIVLLFVSPICAASMALFAARVGQHVLLTLVAAPLLALAWPSRPRMVLPSVIFFTLIFWIWHLPQPYAATLEADWLYLFMSVTLLFSAWLAWSAILTALPAAPGAAVIGTGLLAGQMTILAAILLFSQDAWHEWHIATTSPYGLTALQDQQIAAAIMWTGGGVILLGAVAFAALKFLRGSGLDVSWPAADAGEGPPRRHQ